MGSRTRQSILVLALLALVGCGNEFKGETGEQGSAGEQGSEGPAGKDGKDGKDGSNGQDGQDGKDYTPDLKNILYISSSCNNIDVFRTDIDGIYFAVYSSRIFILGPVYQYIWKASSSKYCQLRIVDDKLEEKYKP